MDPNSNNASFIDVNNSIVNNGNRTCKRSRNYAEIAAGSVMANEIVQNKAFTMLYKDMMENYESIAVADRYDNVHDSDNGYEFVDNDNEDMDNNSKASMEEQSEQYEYR